MITIKSEQRLPRPVGSTSIEDHREWIRTQLDQASRDLAGRGLAEPFLDGKLLRPLLAFLTVPPHRRESLDDRFWNGILAVEMVHEASLLHDDVLDEAGERRGRPTVFASSGAGPALVLGDHLLTSAYVAAVATKSPAFLETFVHAVERTVAGEIAQGKAQGSVLSRSEYSNNITAKSGELFRCALSLWPNLSDQPDVAEAGRVGARIGRLYQMIDDLLDYCPSLERGKPPLQDWRQRKWTWPLEHLEEWNFDLGEIEILSRLFRGGHGSESPMARAVSWLESEVNLVVWALDECGLETREVRGILETWIEMARGAVSAEEPVTADSRMMVAPVEVSPGGAGKEMESSPMVSALARATAHLGTPAGRLAYFSRHAKSFRFASRLFPDDALERVASVYAFCRFTDDLVDESEDERPETVADRLDVWRNLAFQAYRGEPTTVPFLDSVMETMRAGNVPFHYADDLISGVGMDLQPRSFPSLESLRVYSYRVASTVGGWLTELFGVHDKWVLDRAFALGHAMQLTNILRDVGEDLASGRLYLPADRMAAHGIDRELLLAKRENGLPAFPGYRSLMEELMAVADEDYALAFSGIPSLPPEFRGPVAVAARVYQGIHDEIRKNGYDNLQLRARTHLHRKLLLGFNGWRDLRRMSAKNIPLKPNAGISLAGTRDDDGSEVAA